MSRIFVDDEPVEFRAGDSLLTAIVRAGRHPTDGGCLCAAGDCPHCLACVDGVAYSRTCQIQATPETRVELQHLGAGIPPMPTDETAEPTLDLRHRFVDVVVVGGGSAGRRAADEARRDGRTVALFDARAQADDQAQADAGAQAEVLGLYHGPSVLVRTPEGLQKVFAEHEIVIATGAAEIQPVVPGTGLTGLVTRRAADLLHDAGVDLGTVLAFGEPPERCPSIETEGELVRLEGADGNDRGPVKAVVMRLPDGTERRLAGDTVSFGLGLYPRDALLRMGRGLPVRAVGDAAREATVPPCPREGTVCPCSGVTVDDLDFIWRQGFQELELVKRATLAGTGTCQGGACLPHIRSFLAEKGGRLQPAFTARPMTRQPTLAEIAAGAHHRATPRTALHDEHLSLGAHMERAGGWWRPWSYGETEAERRAVRERVSLGDVSTLGKFLISGHGAAELLDFIYPVPVSKIRPGRSRYALLLDERGYVLDDGLVCRLAPTADGQSRFYLTLTSAGSTFGEMWLRDWAEARSADVRILNVTQTFGAINVTGPRAAELLAQAGAPAHRLPKLSRHRRLKVAGVPCRALRLSFTGELSYELHVAHSDTVRLWRSLMRVGRDLGIAPHGLEALLALRLEKGHLVVGQDTSFDATPRRLDHAWAVRQDDRDFVGRAALERTGKISLDRRLVGLEMPSPAPIEGATIWDGHRFIGNVTSSVDSPALGKAVMLAWLDLASDGSLPERVTVDGRPARRVELPFYDPEHLRSRKAVSETAAAIDRNLELPDIRQNRIGRFERLELTRWTDRPERLDQLSIADGALALRTAPDELWLEDRLRPTTGLIIPETGFFAWDVPPEALQHLEETCPWQWPTARPALAQGLIAGLPAKLWLEQDRNRLVVAACWAAEMEERLP